MGHGQWVKNGVKDSPPMKYSLIRYWKMLQPHAYYLPINIGRYCSGVSTYLLNMDIMPKADSKNAFVSGPVVKSDTKPAMVFNIICPLEPTNTSNTMRTSAGDNGNWSSRHAVDGLESNMVRARRTMAVLTLGLPMSFSISVAIAFVTSSSTATKVDIVPTSSMN